MKKSERPAEAGPLEAEQSRAGRVPGSAPGGPVLVAAFGSLADAEAAARDLPEVEIVGTQPRTTVAASRPWVRRAGYGAVVGLVTAVVADGVLALLGPPGLGPLPIVCLLVGVVSGVGGAARPLAGPHEPGTVVATRYELRAPADAALALRDRVRAQSPAGLVELGTAAPRAPLAPAPLGALDHRVRTADEALGLTPR